MKLYIILWRGAATDEGLPAGGSWPALREIETATFKSKRHYLIRLTGIAARDADGECQLNCARKRSSQCARRQWRLWLGEAQDSQIISLNPSFFSGSSDKMEQLAGISRVGRTFHLQSSLKPPDLAIHVQACIRFTSLFQSCFIALDTSRKGLASVKKVRWPSRNSVSQLDGLGYSSPIEQNARHSW